MSKNSTSSDRRRSLRAVGALTLVIGGTGLSLLLWGRLRLITNVPRTVYAQPESPAETQAGTQLPSQTPGQSSGGAEGLVEAEPLDAFVGEDLEPSASDPAEPSGN